MVRVPKRLAVVAAVSAVATVGLPGPGSTPVQSLAPAVAAAAAKQGPVDRALARLQAAQNKDGGFGRRPGEASDPVTSVWAGLALASLGIHPADQPAKGRSAQDYLIGRGSEERGIQLELRDSSDLAAFALVTQAMGMPDVGVGVGSRLLERQASSGGISERPNGKAEVRATALATLALLKDPAPGHREATADTVKWLKAAAFGGGWGATSGAAPRPDTTGIALMALSAAAPDEYETATKAQAYLSQAANADGGFGAAKSSRSKPLATAWVMLGLEASGLPARELNGGGEGVATKTYLAKQQDADGGFGDTLTTAQTIPGFNASAITFDKAVKRHSPLATRTAGGPKRENGAAGGGKGGGQPGDGAQAGDDGNGNDGGPTGDDGTPGVDTSGDDTTPSAPGGGTPAPSIPDTPASSSPAPTPTPTPTPTATTPKPADDTVAAAGGSGDDDDPASGSATRQVNGVVVGARAAAASTAPGVAAGGGDAGDRGTAVLGGLIVALVLVGTQLERRRPRRIVS